MRTANLDMLAARVTIGGATGSIEIIETAYDALDEILSDSDGTRTDTFLQLATADDLTASEAEVLLKKSFGELGIAWPSHDEAVNRLIVYWLSLIVEKRIKPYDGMAAVINDVLETAGELRDCIKYVGDWVHMEELLGAFDAYSDVYESYQSDDPLSTSPEEAIKDLDELIVEMAQDWLDRFAGNDKMRRKAAP